jgi:hypothetical protein
MFSEPKRAIWSRTIFMLAGGLCLSGAAVAAVPDLVYVHCTGTGGDYRISELNHEISQFSVRYQQYRPLCPECDILEWGNKITMKDGATTYIQFDRITGDVSIQRTGVRVVPASYRGTCARGTIVTAKTVRAF